MKTAVSVPDEIFHRAEHLASSERRSRSDVYSSALRDYLAHHAPDEVTEALDKVVERLGPASDPFVAGAGRRILESTEW